MLDNIHNCALPFSRSQETISNERQSQVQCTDKQSQQTHSSQHRRLKVPDYPALVHPCKSDKLLQTTWSYKQLCCIFKCTCILCRLCPKTFHH